MEEEPHHQAQVPFLKHSNFIHHDVTSEDHPGKVSCKAKEIGKSGIDVTHQTAECTTIQPNEPYQSSVIKNYRKHSYVVRHSDEHPAKGRRAQEIWKSGFGVTHNLRTLELTTIPRKNSVYLKKCFEPHKQQQEIELKEPHQNSVIKNCRKHSYGVRHSEDHPGKVSRKAKEFGKSGFATHHKETVESTNGSEESEEGKEEHNKDYEKKLDDLENYYEQHKKQQEMQLKECKERCAKNKKKQEEEMKEFHHDHVENMQKMKDTFEKQINEAKRNFKKKLTQINEVKMRLNQDIPTLKTENDGMIDEPEDYWLSYIGKVCLNLQANMYHIVLPDQFAEDWFYKVKDIERDIRDEQLLDDRERDAASRRWEELKGKLDWDPSLEKTLKMLQKDGNSMDRTECLTVEEAERVAEELDKQGRLRGRTSHVRVKQIIEMWKTSTTLIN